MQIIEMFGREWISRIGRKDTAGRFGIWRVQRGDNLTEVPKIRPLVDLDFRSYVAATSGARSLRKPHMVSCMFNSRGAGEGHSSWENLGFLLKGMESISCMSKTGPIWILIVKRSGKINCILKNIASFLFGLFGLR